jgi:hypothetical protein
MNETYTILAYLPGTANLLVLNQEGKRGFLYLRHEEFVPCSNGVAKSAVLKFGYMELDNPQTMSINDIPNFLRSVQ